MENITITTTQFVLFILLTVGATFLSVGIQVGLFLGWKNQIEARNLTSDEAFRGLTKKVDELGGVRADVKTLLDHQNSFQNKFDENDKFQRSLFENYDLKRKRNTR